MVTLSLSGIYRFNSKLACGCNWFSRYALFEDNLKVPSIKIKNYSDLKYFFFIGYIENSWRDFIKILQVYKWP